MTTKRNRFVQPRVYDDKTKRICAAEGMLTTVLFHNCTYRCVVSILLFIVSYRIYLSALPPPPAFSSFVFLFLLFFLLLRLLCCCSGLCHGFVLLRTVLLLLPSRPRSIASSVVLVVLSLRHNNDHIHTVS